VVYGVVTVAIAGAYIIVLSMLGYFLGGYEAFRSPLFTIGFAVFVLFVFVPARDRVKEIIDRTFYRERYEFERTLEKTIDAVSSIINLDRLMRVLMDSLSGALHLDKAGIMLESPGGGFAMSASIGGLIYPKLEETGELVKIVRGRREPLVRRREDDDSRANPVSTIMKEMDAKVIVPLFYRYRLTGLMILGEKLSGAEYVSDDFRLLQALGRQVATAIENARLHEEEKEKERMSLELSSARKIQVGLLPYADPRVEGLEVSGASIPAREVGGDYYDYFPMAGGKLGIAVADVTGKGMASALLMSMVKSALHVTVRAGTEPERIFTSINQMICEMNEKLPVTMFFCVIDPAAMKISFINAGHTFPYVFRRRTGELRFLESVEMPLGVARDLNYKGKSEALENGDELYFYTDGVVEAPDRDGRMFGFEGLERAIKSGPPGSAAGMKEYIIDSVKAFTGKVEPSDDMTVVVAKVGKQEGCEE
jgi:sigma-B regulation protein RsbU (phosphoserine phosphatase)